MRPTETLLRETIAKMADFSFILGVEPPRKEIDFSMSSEWLIHKKVLGLSVIHIGLNFVDFRDKFNPESLEEDAALIKKIFMSHKAYAKKWESVPLASLYRLYVNNYAIEVNSLIFFISEQLEEFQDYHQTKLAEESIKALTPESLSKIQQQTDSKSHLNLHLQRLIPYTSDLISLVFNESIDKEKIDQELTKVSEDYKTGRRGIGSRSQ
ncbi:hypothetical protein [Crocosphaera sp. XPORK-15E]|uniref:hypothetical protein n=1 Tax=Crocosphaera sp. XPORK-15E TaxID=3110247 RepID=UPI002B1FED66|nr:hypothetical protein [Crocosphaera sp. XPORK-15E]MEA5535920.1 hypothetical protein [Crocosphaera sp. XPORK-15E]